jgi:ParB-like chromosome segregation protein Spo0J
MTTLEIPVDQIDIGERRRQNHGDLKALAAGIKRVGLLEPILVDRNGSGRYRLIFGERRLRAVMMLKQPTIRAQLVEQLSEKQLRLIELEENENRKALTEGERTRTLAVSKRVVERAEAAEEILAQSEPKKTGKRGRPKKPASTRSVAEALGTSPESVARAHQHVDIAEEFPFMQNDAWRQSNALAVREHLAEFSKADRDRVASVLKCAKLLDPDDAIKMIENMDAMKPAELQELDRLSRSDDPRDRSLALTRAMHQPPAADPRLNSLEAALESLRHAVKPFPNDPLTPRIQAVIAELKLIHAAVKQVSYDARRQKITEKVQ